jgi:hypothetical protein
MKLLNLSLQIRFHFQLHGMGQWRSGMTFSN